MVDVLCAFNGYYLYDAAYADDGQRTRKTEENTEIDACLYKYAAKLERKSNIRGNRFQC